MRILGAIVLSGVTVLSATSLVTAQSIPVPVPSPKKDAATEAPRPPGSVAGANGASAAPPTTGTVAATVASARPGAGFDGSQRSLADRVSAYLSSVQTLSGNFIQIGPDGGRTEGQFYIQKPGKVRFEYNPPSPIDVIADGSSAQPQACDPGSLPVVADAAALSSGRQDRSSPRYECHLGLSRR